MNKLIYAEIKYVKLVIPNNTRKDKTVYLLQALSFGKIKDKDIEVYFKKKIKIINRTVMYSEYSDLELPEVFEFRNENFENFMTFLNSEIEINPDSEFEIEYWSDKSIAIETYGLMKETLIFKGKKNRVFLGGIYTLDTDAGYIIRAISREDRTEFINYTDINAIEVN